jgi:hypothetical protein
LKNYQKSLCEDIQQNDTHLFFIILLVFDKMIFYKVSDFRMPILNKPQMSKFQSKTFIFAKKIFSETFFCEVLKLSVHLTFPEVVVIEIRSLI